MKRARRWTGKTNQEVRGESRGETVVNTKGSKEVDVGMRDRGGVTRGGGSGERGEATRERGDKGPARGDGGNR